MIELRNFVDQTGRIPFLRWADDLDREAGRRVARALSRLAEGNTSNVKAVGEGVNELKIDFGPGYRVYFGWQGNTIVLLLGGGTKKRQAQDIRDAKERWKEARRPI
jgi:putative addiction module killer protein